MEKQPKRLYRSRQERMIGGVAGGISEYYGVDVTWVRLGFALLTLANGIGALAYIAGMLIIPENPDQKPVAKPTALEGAAENIRAKVADKDSPDRPNYIAGLVLLAVGGFFLMREFIPWFRPDWGALWPFLAIALGLAIILKRD
jgi:phage shock protein C